ncbi:MAG: hypothetical protein R3244_09565 [Thermoanaerobaculia bacterium]|nr:hypothetical protein [Thermoanaerobaculia bacterium]
MGRAWIVSLGIAASSALAGPALAFSPQTSVAIAFEAASITPPDLERQIERWEADYRAGVLDEARDPSAAGEPLDEVVQAMVERGIGMIRTHQPFSEIVRHLGRTAYYVSYANNPLVIGQSDPQESGYFADFLAYVDSARPRFEPVFYGLLPRFESSGRVDDLLAETFRRGQVLYPYIGREYRRVGGPPGRERFDDRSTAFGVSAVAYSQALTDVAIVLRHIWLAAGGADPRPGLPVRKGAFEAPRTSPVPLESFRRSLDR